MMRRAVSVVAVSLAMGGGGYALGRVAPEPPRTVTVGEFDRVPDMRHGDTLNLDMRDDGGQLARCDWYHGELIFNPADSSWTCEGVDF